MKNPKLRCLKDVTVVYTTSTGETRVIFTLVDASRSELRKRIQDASANTAIAYRVERIEISKKELKTA